jgi:uncharacterized protein YukJ
MPLIDGYGVLKCRAIKGETEREDKKSPHYFITGTDTKNNNKKYSVAINVKSVVKPFDLLVFINEDFQHPIVSKLVNLDFGFTKLGSSEQKPGGIALDFIRSNLFDVTKMKPVPADAPGAEDDINDRIDLVVKRAIKTPNVDIYAFGEPFTQGLGIHNIHMNQGDTTGKFDHEDGVFQDGALLIHFPNPMGDEWFAFFSAFQSQSFHTDDRTGKAIDGNVGAEPLPRVTADLKIVAALVNPAGEDPSKETVTVLNTSANTIDLKGWSLADRLKRKMPLTGLLESGNSRLVQLSGKDMQLGNDGGMITLLNPQGLKVDGVSYTRSDAAKQGQTIVF